MVYCVYMNIFLIVLQIFIALVIFNVWIFRFNRKTKFRGRSARNLKQEFSAYGLPVWFMVIIGTLKISLAIMLIVGVWIPMLIKPAGGMLAFLMIGAVLMHVKARDSLFKASPALSLLFLSLLVVLLS